MNGIEQARVAFLNMVEDALRFDEERAESGDAERERHKLSIIYHLTVGHENLLDLALALGIEKKKDESLIDAIDRAVDRHVQEQAGL